MISKDYFGENKTVEFKRELPNNHDKFLKDVIAFANCSGGKILLGIEDDSGEVYGIGDQSPFKLADSISNMISDTCSPQIETDISPATLENKTILEIDVLPGKFRPYYLKNKGKDISSYIRINGTSRPADPRKLQELELEGQSISYDSMQEIGAEFDEDKALTLCDKMKSIAVEACKSEDEKALIKDMTLEKLEDFGVLCKIGKSFYPTHSFNLLTENTNKCAKIQCALFKGTTRDVFIDQKEFDGPIYEQVELAYQFVLRHINLGVEIGGIYRNDSYELPISAIREMIANAVVHRSYLDRSCIQVSIFDDRIEVLSPGLLYGGMDIQTAILGKSTCRNESIAAAFHYMHIVEAWGTGIPRIMVRCEEYGLIPPLFEELGDSFKATMFRRVSLSPEKVSNAPEKVSNAPEKVSNAPEKVSNAPEKVSNAFEFYRNKLTENGISEIFIANIEVAFQKNTDNKPFGQNDITKWLECSTSKATNIMKTMKKAKIIEPIRGFGAGKYKFISY